MYLGGGILFCISVGIQDVLPEVFCGVPEFVHVNSETVSRIDLHHFVPDLPNFPFTSRSSSLHSSADILKLAARKQNSYAVCKSRRSENKYADRSWVSSVSIVTGLLSGQRMVRSPILICHKRVFSFLKGSELLWDPPNLDIYKRCRLSPFLMGKAAGGRS